MASTPSINDLINDEKQTVVIEDGEVVDLDESTRPNRDIGIDDVTPDTSEPPVSATDAGEGGEQPDNTPPVEQDPIEGRKTVIVKRKVRMPINDFTDGFIQMCINEGAVPIAVFKDGTERQVTWSEVFDPRPKTASVTLNVAGIAAAQNQNFWHDTNGAHVTEDTQNDWNEEYSKANHGALANPSVSRPWHNILINSLGVLLRRGLLDMASISRNAIAFFDGTGNSDSNIMAFFGIDGAQIGRTTEKHMVLDAEGVNVYDENGNLAPLHSSNIEADHARINDIEANYVQTDTLEANYAHITNGVIDNASIDHADVNGLDASYAHITNGTIDNATIGYADVDGLNANYAHVTNGVIDNATIDHADVDGLNANYAHITNGKIDNATIGYADVDGLNANYAHVANGVIDNASIGVAKVQGLNAQYAHITNGVIDNADIDQADVRNLEANYAHISDGVIDNATIDHADVDGLNANYAHIASGKIDNATIDAAKVNNLDVSYAKIDMANVNNAWVQNGVIKDGSISDAMINAVSANKLTAGTIDASKITVTNLQAENIAVKKINGQTVSGKSIADALTQHESDISGLDSRIDDEVEALNNRIDGAIETYTGTVIPTLNNEPAKNWTTDAERKKHVGDVYFVVNSNSEQNGYNYRFTQNGNTFNWQLIKDNDVTNALSRLTTAEGKIGQIEQFDSDISAWKTDTDDELSSMKESHTTLVTRVDKTLVETTQLWFTKANTTAPNKPTAAVTSTATGGNAWTTVVPAYNASYPNYYYCYQWKYSDGTYGWSAVTRDIAMGESQSTSRTAASDASTAKTDASNALTTAGTAASDAATAKSDASTAKTDASTAKSDAATAKSDASTAKSDAATAKSTSETAKSTADTAKATADKNVKSSIQLWFSKANTTAPAKPTAKVTSDSTAGNAWRVVVPAYNASYPYYFYCWQYELADGTYSWSNVVYDRATSENQANSRSALSQVSTKVETSTFNTVKQTVEENSQSIGRLTTTTETLTSQVAATNPFITGTQTKATRFWTGTTDALDALVDGQQITYWLPYAYANESAQSHNIAASELTPTETIANNYSNCWLNITLANGTQTGWIPCYYGGGSRITSHYGANNAIHLTYRENAISGVPRGFWADANYVDGNTVYSKYSDTVIAGKNGAKRYTLCLKDDAGNWTSIVNQANNANTSGKTCYTGGLQLGNVLYHAAGADYAAGANTGQMWESYGGLDFRYSTNGVTNANTTTLQYRKPVYLVGTIHDDGLFYLDTSLWWTQTPNDENKIYILLGTAYSTYHAIFLSTDNPTYVYDGGKLVELQTSRIVTTSNKLNSVSDTVDGHTQKIGSLETTVAKKADDSTVTTISNKVNNISDTVDGHTSQLSSITSTQTSIQGSAVKSTVQLWFTKANTTAPGKPTSHITVNDASKANQWNLAVPTYNSSYPNYYYCYEYEYINGTYGWSAVTRDIATGEVQSKSRTAASDAATAKSDASTAKNDASNALTTAETAASDASTAKSDASTAKSDAATAKSDAATAKSDASSAKSTADTTSSNLADYITSNDAALATLQSQVDGQIEAWYKSVDPTTSNEPASAWTTADLKKRHEGDLYYNTQNGHSWRWLNSSGTYSWQQIPDSDAAAALAAAQDAQSTANGKRRIFTAQPTVPYDKGDLWVNGSVVKYSTTNRSTGNYTAGDWVTTATDDTTANAAASAAATAQSTANKNVKESKQLWFTKANNTAPSKPTAAVTTNNAATGNAWNLAVPTYNASYPHYFYCMQYKLADGTYTWSEVIYDRATTEAQSVARTTSGNLTTLQNNYAEFKQTMEGFQSTVGETYATKNELSTVAKTGTEYIVGTQTASTASWTGVTNDSALYAGKSIAYYLPYATPSGGTSTLNLTLSGGGTTGAKNVRINNSNVTTHFPAGSVINLTWDGTYWKTSNYDSNSNTYDRRLHNDNITALAAVTAGHLIAGVATGYKQLAASLAFDLAYPILYASGAIAANATAKNTYEAIPGINFSTTGTIQSGAANKMLWLKGSVNGSTFTIASSNWLTTVVPTSTDNMFYIPLGVLTSATNGYFSTSDKLYAFLDGKFQRVDISSSTRLTSVENRVTNAETEISQNTDAIALRAKSSDVYTRSSVDGLISTEVSNRNAAIAESASAINLSVSQNYTSKTEFNALQIGGRNLLGNTNNPYVPDRANNEAGSTFGSIGRYNSPASEFSIETYSGSNNSIIVTSSVTGNRGVGWYTQPGIIQANTDYTFSCQVLTNVSVSIHIHTAWRNGNATAGYTGWTAQGHTTISPEDWYPYSFTFKPSASANLEYEFYVAICFTGNTNGVVCRFANAKLEKGTKATDWSPAPEDIEAYTDAQVSAAEAAIKITTDNITTEVSKKTDKSAVISTINQSAESIKISASKVDIEGAAIFSSGGALNKVVSATQTEWYSSTSASSKAGGSWATTQPSIVAGRFIWERQKITYSDGTSEYKPSAEGVCVQGQTNLSAYSTTSQMNSAIGTAKSEAISSANSTTDTKLNDYATKTSLTAETNARKAVYATSSTDAGTQAKVAACSNFALYTGASVTVTFSKANTHATPTLNVNSTGAKSIKGYTGAALTEAEYKWVAGAAITFVYDGTNWRMQDAGAQQAKADAASSASTASTKASAAATSATNAATSASNASSSASAAATSASNASTSASTASTKATAAATSATNAATSASNASSSASAAATSASNASSSASTASTKATEAANSATTALKASKGWYAESTTAADQAVKVATITPSTTAFNLTDAKGTVVHVKFSVTNTAAVANLKLNVNSTGDKPIKTIRNNSLTTIAGVGYLVANVVYEFYYDGTNWVMQENYNTDTINRTRWQNVIKAREANALTSGHLICGNSSGYKNIAASVTFDLSFPILYAGTTQNTSGGTTDNNYLNINGINFSTTGTIQNGTQYAPIYLKGTVSGNTFTVASSNFLTCTIPTSADSFFYIPVGMLYNSTTNGYFSSSKNLYAYIDGKFRQVTPTEVVATQLIYISKASGTSSVSANTTWVTANSDSQNTWTTKRPTYNTSYPVLFVATQTKRLDGTVTCTAPVKDDTTTIIDGGHITTGTIDASKATITHINASNITTGTLSADRIAAGAITVGKLDTTTQNNITAGVNAKSAIDNLEIGGRNLFSNSQTMAKTWVLDGATLSDDIVTIASNGKRVYQMPASSYFGAFVIGETYTASIDAKGTSTASVLRFTAVGAGSLSKDCTLDTTWKRYTFTFTAPTNSSTTGSFSFYNGGNDSIQLRLPKIEKGNKATDWSPAPEDVDTAIDTKANSNDVYTKSQADGKFYNEQVITSSTADKDLDNYTTTGIYHCGTSMTNAPLTNNGTVVVEWNVGTKYQEYHPDNQTYYYKRLYRSSAWESWTKIDAVGAYSIATTANNTANAAAPKTSAVAEEQYIYIQAVSGTNSVSGTTTWVSATGESTTSDTAGLTPTWTTKRPTYRSKYPVIFVAKQKKMVSGTVSCSTPVKDDTLTIIDGGHITTGTIDASKATITNINASNITTGTLSADRIAAGAITVGKLDTTTQNNITAGVNAKSAIDNLEIGGRNLAKGKPSASTATTEVTITTTGTDTSKYIEGVTFTIARVEGATQYVLSFEAYASVARSIRCHWYSPNTTTKAITSTGAESNGSDGNININITTEWKRYWVVWTQSDSVATNKILIVGRSFNLSSGNSTVHIRAIKMEVGNKPTSWSPAPEDVNSSITQVQTNLTTEINQRKAVFAKSTTAAGTAAKVTESGTPANFALYTGANVSIQFTTANTATTPTLNVNETGAKTIRGYTGGALTESEYKWAANAIIDFVYDGTYWRMQDAGAQQAKAAAASSASAAATSATNASSSATNAATSATNAASSASTASTKATNAATSATNAASSASAAATSASNASSSATTASTKASNAATSATNAASSASAAATSATNASSSATSAANSATAAAEVMGGFTILWNYSNFSTVNPGEAYICAFDPATGSKSDANGWVKFAGTRRTISKEMMNPNAILPYNIPIYIVCRLSSTTATTGTNYMVWYNSGWKYSVASPSAVGGSWTWTDGTDIILGKFVEPGNELDFTECEIYNPPLTAKHVSSDTVTARSANALATTANNTANAAAPKTSAIAEEQRIYYRSNSATAPTSGPTTWVTATSNSNATWVVKRIPNIDSSNTAYKYLYTCIQKKTVSGAITCSTILLDDSVTVIDGGNIITGSVAANQIAANAITAAKIATGAITTDKVAANAITADKIVASGLTIGYSQLTGTPTIPSKTSQLTNDSNFETTSGAQTKANEAASAAETNAINDTTNKLKSYSTTTQMNGAIETAKSDAISTAAQDATNKVSAVQEALESVEETANAANSKSVSFRGVNSVAADTAAKTVACSGFVLSQGYSITVYNSTANTVAGKLTLNVNNTGAKDIYVGGAVTSDTNRLLWASGSIITFIYDGSRFRVADNPGSWYGATCSVAEGTDTKTTTINQVVIFKGTAITVPMSYSNTATDATMNVSSLGGTSIYYGNSTTIPTKANGYAWPAGAAVIFTYDGKFWRTGNQTFINGSNILTGTIAADRIKANVISAVNNGTGTINADRINASGLTIGYSQLTGTPSIPSKVTDLSDGSSYLTSSSASNTYATKTSLTDETNARKAIYGTCATTSATQIKVATCSNFTLYTGAAITIKFSYSNTNSAPQLNVNSTGAKEIKDYTGADLVQAEYNWINGSVITFVYDGTYWRMQDNGTLGKASDAAKTASNYITAVDSDGIRVHAASNPTSNYALINASGLDVYISGSSYAKFGSTARIGLSSGWHTNINTSGMEVLNNSTSYASFGTTARIGVSSGRRVTIDSNGVRMFNTDNKAIFTADGNTIKVGNTAAGYFSVETDSDKITFKSGKSSFANLIYNFEPMYDSDDDIVVLTGCRFLAGSSLTGSTGLDHSQIILGSCNVKRDNALLVIGNGSSTSNRSNALELSTSGALTLGTPLSKANGGTGTNGRTVADFSVITTDGDDFSYSGLAANPSLFEVHTNGVVQSLYLYEGKLSSSLSSGSSATLGTLPSGYRPKANYVYTYAGVANSTFAGKLLVRIGSAGVIVLYNYSGSSLSTSTNINIFVTWAI